MIAVLRAGCPCAACTHLETPIVEACTRCFSLCCLADVQHADIKDGFSFHGVPRYYRHALEGLGRAVDHFKAEQVDFAVHLGDVSVAGGHTARERGRVARVAPQAGLLPFCHRTTDAIKAVDSRLALLPLLQPCLVPLCAPTASDFLPLTMTHS